MLKEALGYLVSLGKTVPATETVGDTTYVLDSNGRIMYSVDQENVYNAQNAEMSSLDHAHVMEMKRLENAYEMARRPAATIKTGTLTSIVQYIKTNPEAYFDDARRPLIHIASATNVKLLTRMDIRGDRQLVIDATAKTPDITFGRHMPTDAFIIMLQTQFVPETDGDFTKILKLVSNLTDQESFAVKDTGIRQIVTIKKGAADIAEEGVPNPVTLAPFRTFIEADQPRGYYLLRIDSKACPGLFEVGGNEWQITAMNNIRMYLEAELASMPVDILM